ncbi:growth hormone receptor a [Notothenia coriiceps]|uniref:Growth hormone receptor n=1 Tax=Notothenia coriiceps TaxID=8208 RepID=A0A6I9MYE5_9TELE|nr:PREDICTED: growth hormone receptor [Notothenia coriiceps]XP_010766971.1 PREDICTED: growth hormone receptor [Notothenia coriiceps]
MAFSSYSSNLLLILLISSLGWLSSPGSAFLTDRERLTSSAIVQPYITECISSNQETFRCWWSQGDFHNLSSPGALKIFYHKKAFGTHWKECPEYIYPNRECFFDRNHTSIWTLYCVQLRSQNNITYFNECFNVENIVRPDPPISLNWTLLNVSPSGLSYDVMVNWDSPPSADIKTGWMRIEYEIQYREKNSTEWEALEMQPHTKQTIFGLHIGKEYQVHIRCRMLAFIRFGEFSDSIFIQVTEISIKDSTFPLTLVLVFGVVGVLILIMLIVVSQQHRFMMILLPPVPAPKIKGIDPELLKKGKLDELNFILSGGGMGGLPTYAQDFYQDEPWVEFIEVDAEDADTGEKEENQGSDTQKLLGLCHPASHHMNTGCSNAVSFPDDDSGRASCYDPDLPEQDPLMLIATLLSSQTEDVETSFNVVERAPAPERGERPLVQTQTGGPQTWVNTDFYAQVSNVMPSGGVVLSPGQQLRIQESTSATEEETQKKGKSSENTEDKRQKELQLQMLMVDPEGSGYTTESIARQISTPPALPMPGEGYQTIQPQPVETKPAAMAEDNQSPYILPDSSQSQFFAPVADYTVVQEVDSQHSLLLKPPARQSPPPCMPQHPLKALPAMPMGYITPDLLGNLAP